MKKGLSRKGIILGIIILFIGVGIQPVFAEVSIESENPELTEITIEICEVDKACNNTVILTQYQAEELEGLINNFKIEIDSAENIDETVAIFKKMVVSLNELGLIPKGMNVEEAQRLVTGAILDKRIVKSLESLYSKYKGFLEDVNIFCLISGYSSNTVFLSPVECVVAGIRNLLLKFFQKFNLLYYLLPHPFYRICSWFLYLGSYIWNYNLLPIGYEIGYGVDFGSILGGPAEGWIIVTRLWGKKIYKGSFYGNLPFLKFIHEFQLCFPGTLGFTGIKIQSNDYQRESFYLGSALWVRISTEYPG